MALSRRTGARFQASIWPGFVDAMTGLLLVLMFVLTIFMVVQFTLRETISGQASELDTLSAEVAALADPTAQQVIHGTRKLGGFVRVDEAACDQDALLRWLHLCLAHAATLPAKT